MLFLSDEIHIATRINVDFIRQNEWILKLRAASNSRDMHNWCKRGLNVKIA